MSSNLWYIWIAKSNTVGAIGLRETELEEDYGDDLEQIPALDNIDAEEVRAAAAAAAAAANSAGKAEGFSESYSDDLPTGKFGGSGLNLSAMVLADHQRKKNKQKKKKRRLLMDEVTELTRTLIKRNLTDKSDIVRTVLSPKQRPLLRASKRLRPLDVRMKLPSQRGLPPELLEMFSWTMRDDPLPFRLVMLYIDCWKASP